MFVDCSMETIPRLPVCNAASFSFLRTFLSNTFGEHLQVQGVHECNPNLLQEMSTQYKYSKLNIMQLIAAKDRVEAVEAPEKCTILGGKAFFWNILRQV